MHHTLPRRILILAGSREWGFATVTTWLTGQPRDEVVWLGDVLPEGIAVTQLSRREQLLGDEYGIAVLDGWAGFDPEQFGAVSGTVRGGGALVLLLPPGEQWLHYADPAQARIALWPHTPETLPNRFIARTLRILRAAPAVEWFDEQSALPAALQITPRAAGHTILRSTDQQQAIAAVQQVVKGHRRRPLVLLADRGRGKSSALGIAAAGLLRDGLQRIIVTAPHRNAVATLYARAAAELPGALREEGALLLGEAAMRFVPPDELLRARPFCDLLLVDEAAAIPTPLLTQLLQHYPRIAFASTVHGYEGTGQGDPERTDPLV
jgi:tRNA(Met) cytidine acetyltransferase